MDQSQPKVDLSKLKSISLQFFSPFLSKENSLIHLLTVKTPAQRYSISQLTPNKHLQLFLKVMLIAMKDLTCIQQSQDQETLSLVLVDERFYYFYFESLTSSPNKLEYSLILGSNRDTTSCQADITP